MFPNESVSLGPQLKEGGVEGIVRLRWVIPGEMAVDRLHVTPHLLLSVLWNILQHFLQILHLIHTMS